MKIDFCVHGHRTNKTVRYHNRKYDTDDLPTLKLYTLLSEGERKRIPKENADKYLAWFNTRDKVYGSSKLNRLLRHRQKTEKRRQKKQIKRATLMAAVSDIDLHEKISIKLGFRRHQFVIH